MDLYTNPVEGSYQISRLKWFEMPNTNGTFSHWVIAVPTPEAQNWIIAYSILVGMIYSALSKLMTVLVLALYPEEGGPNLQAMLVAFYNSNSAAFALSSMFSFALQSLKSESRVEPKKKFRGKGIGFWCCISVLCSWKLPDKNYRANRTTLKYCFALAGASLCLIAGDLVTKFVVGGSRLIVRHASRANPDVIYFPAVQDNNGTSLELIQPLRTAAAMQAAGRVEAAKGLIGNLTYIRSTSFTDDQGRPNIALNFSYSITGADMGLQMTPKLNYTVKGQCRTEYSWVNTTTNPRHPDYDWYPLWGSTYDKLTYTRPPADALFPVWVNVVPRYLTAEIPKMQGGDEYALVPSVAYRQSFTPNDNDPWYLTEKRPGNLTIDDPIYQVRRQRPPVLCWQNATWSLHKVTVTSVDDLDKLPGLRISTLVRNIFKRDFVSPTLTQVANNLGYASLASSMNTVPNKKVIAAARCSVIKDLERLIQISFVSSRDAIRNVVLLYSAQRDTLGLPNAAAGPDGHVPYDDGDFILESKDVAALAVWTLLSVPSICAILWSTVFALSIRWDKIGANKGKISRLNFRRIALQAVQLYRFLDEEITGLRRYSGRLSTPYISFIDEGTEVGEKVGEKVGERQDHYPPTSALQRAAPGGPQTSAPRQTESGNPQSSELKEEEAGIRANPPLQQPPPPEPARENESLLSKSHHPSLSRIPLHPDGYTYGDCVVPKLVPIDASAAPTPPEQGKPPRRCEMLLGMFDKKEERPERFELVMTARWKEDINHGQKVRLDEVVSDYEPREAKTTGADLELGPVIARGVRQAGAS